MKSLGNCWDAKISHDSSWIKDWFIKGQWLGHFNPFYKKDPWISMMKPWEKPWFPKSFSNQSIIHPLNSRTQKRSTQAHGGAGASWRIGFSNWSNFWGATGVRRRCITCVNPSKKLDQISTITTGSHWKIPLVSTNMCKYKYIYIASSAILHTVKLRNIWLM